MAEKTLGALIKEARAGAGLTQEQLARKVAGLSAADISKAERNQMTPTQAQLKAIAKATGVTQSSLLNAAKGTGSSGNTSSASSPASASSGTKMTLTATEKKLVELYRAADSATKKNALKLLKGEELTESGGGSILGGSGDLLGSALGNFLTGITGKK